MRRSALLFGPVLLVLIISVGTVVQGGNAALGNTSTPGDLYWVAYSHLTADFKEQVFLMQIDALGNVTVSPRAVVPASVIGSQFGAIALAKNGPDRIVIWINKGERGNSGHGYVRRAAISNPGLKFLSMHQTTVRTTNVDWLSVTQRPAQNLLAAVVENNQEHFVSAYGLTALQALNGIRWLLSPSICQNGFCGNTVVGGGVLSSDGAYALFTVNPRLYLQRLASDGRPLGKAELLNSITLGGRSFPYYTGADISGPLIQGRRIAIFGTERSGDSGRPAKIYLQLISESGKRIGTKELLLDGPYADMIDGSGLAIDPKGRFFLASSQTNTGRSVLVYQAIDGTFRSSGRAKVIAEDVSSNGIDILKQ